MVGLANVPEVKTEGLAKSSPLIWQVESTPDRVAGSVTFGKEQKLPWKPTGEESRSRTPDVPDVVPTMISLQATGAQVPSPPKETVGTDYLAFYNVMVGARRESLRETTIVELPSPGRLVTSFEPHLRQSTVKNLQMLFGQFRHSIGQPMAAITKAELVDTLTTTYKKTVLHSESRNFASAVSLLQDFLRPHWSEISPEKIDAISGSLGTLVSRTELSPSVLEGFYRDLAGVIGSGISVDVEEDEKEVEEADDNSE
jgi:hypothetical protein